MISAKDSKQGYGLDRERIEVFLTFFSSVDFEVAHYLHACFCASLSIYKLNLFFK